MTFAANAIGSASPHRSTEAVLSGAGHNQASRPNNDLQIYTDVLVLNINNY